MLHTKPTTIAMSNIYVVPKVPST